MWEELAGTLDTAINSLSANHAYLKTLYFACTRHICFIVSLGKMTVAVLDRPFSEFQSEKFLTFIPIKSYCLIRPIENSLGDKLGKITPELRNIPTTETHFRCTDQKYTLLRMSCGCVQGIKIMKISQ